MSAPTMPLILEFLAGRPNGATGNEVVSFIGSDQESVLLTLQKLLGRGQIDRSGDGTRATTTYRLRRINDTPPVFRASETLERMQTAARLYANSQRVP